MTKQTLSVQRALGELKILDARILRQSREGRYTTYLKGGKPVRGNKGKEDFATEAKSQLQSAQDLIKRRRSIKRAIVQSNAVTEISIAGLNMTVAEAIEMKDSIVLERTLLAHIKNDFVRTQNTVDFERMKADTELNKRIELVLGKEAKQDANLADQVADLTKLFNDQNKVELFDPAKVEDFISSEQKKIEDFLNDIDNLLLESNVKTSIEVEA